MKWLHAASPSPEISQPWRDALWPPSKWYDFPDAALDKIDTLWRFDEPETAKTVAGLMTKQQLMLWAVLNIVGQVCNGGFSQALYNSYGELAEEAVTGLSMFGFTRHAEILEEAWTLFGVRPIPIDREARIQRLEALANIEQEAADQSSNIEHASAVFQGTSARWYELESELFALLQAKTHGKGYDAAFYRPLSEWIYENRGQFFIT